MVSLTELFELALAPIERRSESPNRDTFMGFAPSDSDGASETLQPVSVKPLGPATDDDNDDFSYSSLVAHLDNGIEMEGGLMDMLAVERKYNPEMAGGLGDGAASSSDATMPGLDFGAADAEGRGITSTDVNAGSSSDKSVKTDNERCDQCRLNAIPCCIWRVEKLKCTGCEEAEVPCTNVIQCDLCREKKAVLSARVGKQPHTGGSMPQRQMLCVDCFTASKNAQESLQRVKPTVTTDKQAVSAPPRQPKSASTVTNAVPAAHESRYADSPSQTQSELVPRRDLDVTQTARPESRPESRPKRSGPPPASSNGPDPKRRRRNPTRSTRSTRKPSET